MFHLFEDILNHVLAPVGFDNHLLQALLEFNGFGFFHGHALTSLFEVALDSTPGYGFAPQKWSNHVAQRPKKSKKI
jgi:hypothetical protein